ncbi:hypothetical protein D3C76_1063320 [compost metagenome]
MFGNPGKVFFAGGGVNNEAEEIFSEVINDQVINHAAGGIEHPGVERFAWRLELCNVVRQQITQKLPGATAAQIDDGHVGDIEHPGVGAHCMVLIDLRAVVQRHHPTVEIDHARAA